MKADARVAGRRLLVVSCLTITVLLGLLLLIATRT